jgi:hypothetical protein
MQNLEDGFRNFLILGLSDLINLIFYELSNLLFDVGIRLIKALLNRLKKKTPLLWLFLENWSSVDIVGIFLAKVHTIRLPQFSSHVLFLRPRIYPDRISTCQRPYSILANEVKMGIL